MTIHKLAKTSSMLLATLADMEKLLKSMEDRIIAKLSDQLSADRATIDRHDPPIQQMELSLGARLVSPDSPAQPCPKKTMPSNLRRMICSLDSPPPSTYYICICIYIFLECMAEKNVCFTSKSENSSCDGVTTIFTVKKYLHLG